MHFSSALKKEKPVLNNTRVMTLCHTSATGALHPPLHSNIVNYVASDIGEQEEYRAGEEEG